MSRLRLTNAAKKSILDHSPEKKNELALALGCSEGSINRYLRESENDDTLTKASALVIIHKKTGLSFKAMLEPMPPKKGAFSANRND